jgi:hypothetical protein
MSRLSGEYGNYTYSFGNTLFVIINPEDQTDGVGIYHSQVAWFDSIIKNNKGKNIFVISHHPLYLTDDGDSFTSRMSIMESEEFKNIVLSNDNIVGWFNGHLHENGGKSLQYGNCFCLDCDAINGQFTSQGFFLKMNIGKKVVNVFKITFGDSCVSRIFTFNLKYEFEYGGS